MADGTFNVAKGTAVQLVKDNPNSLGLMILESAEADADLEDHDDLAALLGAAGNIEAGFTNYVRKTGITETVTVDDVASEATIDMPDQSYATAGNGTNETTAKVIIFVDVGGTEATRIPLSHQDFVETTDGGPLEIQIHPDGFYRARQP